MSTSKLFLNPVTFRNTNDSSSVLDTSSSVFFNGGIVVSKTLNIGGSLTTIGDISSNGDITCDGTIAVPKINATDINCGSVTGLTIPSGSTDAVNKSYLDGLYYSSSYPQITNVGTLTDLNVSGTTHTNELDTSTLIVTNSLVSNGSAVFSNMTSSTLTATNSIDTNSLVVSGTLNTINLITTNSSCSNLTVGKYLFDNDKLTNNTTTIVSIDDDIVTIYGTTTMYDVVVKGVLNVNSITTSDLQVKGDVDIQNTISSSNGFIFGTNILNSDDSGGAYINSSSMFNVKIGNVNRVSVSSSNVIVDGGMNIAGGYLSFDNGFGIKWPSVTLYSDVNGNSYLSTSSIFYLSSNVNSITGTSNTITSGSNSLKIDSSGVTISGNVTASVLNVSSKIYGPQQISTAPLIDNGTSSFSLYRYTNSSASTTYMGDVWNIGSVSGSFFVSTNVYGHLIDIDDTPTMTIACPVHLANSSTVNKDCTFQQKIIVEGTTCMMSNAEVSDAMTVGSNLTVSNSVIVDGTADSVNSYTGALQVLNGGASVAKNLHVGGNIVLSETTTLHAPASSSSMVTVTFPDSLPNTAGQLMTMDTAGNIGYTTIKQPGMTTFSCQNNVSEQIVDGLKFETGFSIDIYATMTTTTTSYSSIFTLKCVSTDLFVEQMGTDDVGVTFTVDVNGQVYYSTDNVTNWCSTVLKWRVDSDYYTSTGVYNNLYGTNIYSSGASIFGTIQIISSEGQTNVDPTLVSRLLITSELSNVVIYFTSYPKDGTTISLTCTHNVTNISFSGNINGFGENMFFSSLTAGNHIDLFVYNKLLHLC